MKDGQWLVLFIMSLTLFFFSSMVLGTAYINPEGLTRTDIALIFICSWMWINSVMCICDFIKFLLGIEGEK